ncbi:MAG: hypothetical protein WKG07_33870 [Hymenobacter sp.]
MFTTAGYTYGPLLGLFAFGILTRRGLRDRLVLPVCVAAVVLHVRLSCRTPVQWLSGYKFGFEILLLNGALALPGPAGHFAARPR